MLINAVSIRTPVHFYVERRCKALSNASKTVIYVNARASLGITK